MQSCNTHNVEILVLDFGSQYTQLIARRLREYGIYTEIVPYFESLDSIRAKNPKGIILSGGPASVYEEGAYKPDSGVFELGIPVLGICYGMQYIAHFFGGKVVRAEAQEFGKAVLEVLDSANSGAKSGVESSAACENVCVDSRAKTKSADSASLRAEREQSAAISSVDSGAESIVLETERTYLHEYAMSDLSALQGILDEKTMYAWGHAFSENECREWIELQLARYEKYGFGLWAVVDKASGQIIGNAGLNYEEIELADSAFLGNGAESCLESGADSSANDTESKKREILELGYIINHRFWKQGLGLEVARACAEYAFRKLGAKQLYCLIKDDNTRSLRLARKLGMRVVGENIKHYRGQDMPHLVLKAGELVAWVNAERFSQKWGRKCANAAGDGTNHNAEPMQQDSGDKNGALQGESRELPKAVMTADEPKQSPFLAQKPTQNKLFTNVKQDSIVWMSHADKVETLPSGFVELAKSGNTHYCAIADFTRQIYALQFHPEVVHSECGGEILKNFALGICGADNAWNMKNFAEAEIAKLREKVLGVAQNLGGLETLDSSAACGGESKSAESGGDSIQPDREKLRFCDITEQNYERVCALHISDEDKGFIESNADSIKEAQKSDYWQTKAIYSAGAPVGFVMYGYVPSEDRVWIDRFMIDSAHSGRGLGRRAMQHLIAQLRAKFGREEIYTSVYEANTRALRFYEKLGFVANGERDRNNELVLVCRGGAKSTLSSLEAQNAEGGGNAGCGDLDEKLPQRSLDSVRQDFGKNENSKIFDEKCGLQEKSQGSLLDINDRSDFSQLPHLSPKAEFSKVLCAVSGGVDSSVVATLLYRAIGENLIPVFVDTGLLRKGEREAVEKMFKENLKVPLIVADARELFLGRLQGVIDPEKKRKIIGETFIEVFEYEAKKHNTKGEIKFLAQGTLYPDVIESVSVKGPSKTIKSHHNVGGLPEWMRFELIEPLRELFKDEVRALGRELGMPESMLMRHPFPGPGLAIRIMGEVNSADLELLKEADSIFIEELHKWGLYDSVWQGFCVLLNVRSVGVMGDNRTYDNTICVRAVEAMDGMTAGFSHLPHEFLESVSNRIINEVEGINRVVYDITSKPPGTIEWE